MQHVLGFSKKSTLAKGKGSRGGGGGGGGEENSFKTKAAQINVYTEDDIKNRSIMRTCV